MILDREETLDSSLPYRPCVGIVLFNNVGQVFVARRNDIETPSWQLPQGGINPGEREQEAALRELAEETGIKSVEIIDQMPNWLTYDYPKNINNRSFSKYYRGQKQLWFAMRFTGTEDEIDLGNWNAEFNAWKWTHINSITSMIVSFKRPVYAEIVDYFSHFSDQPNNGGY
ncbi:MAG: RNA pyrophosphohydrolase [Rhodospirillaceae bacterium]|nr:RNA pyrophosphohydrolase [Rhodospirillaceae bacterium]|tara:strand:+ start:1139 stop:1651 length:513 start_codon:yes stop_codon:yes gene_type:complete